MPAPPAPVSRSGGSAGAETRADGSSSGSVAPDYPDAEHAGGAVREAGAGAARARDDDRLRP